MSIASIFKKDAEKGKWGGIYHSICLYAKANNKCMKHYDKNKESRHIQYWFVNNLVYMVGNVAKASSK